MQRLWSYRLMTMLGAAAVLALLAGGGISPGTSHADPTSAIITNGTVMLGVNDTGSLNAPGGSPSSGEGETIVGLRFVATNADATSPGCTCEGWGAGDLTTAVEGHANSDSGDANLTLVSFTVDADSAVAVVEIGTTLRVTHNYQPSAISDNVYDVDVTIENISDDPVHLLYRRSMDWDIEPTAFEEYVTMVPGDSPELIYTSDGGFDEDNVLEAPEFEIAEGAFVDSGPEDHGALFDFDFGTLGAGDTKAFTTFYGATGNETDALDALAAVGAEAYTLGQPSSEGGPDLGEPNTFFFGFKGIGGSAIGGSDDPTPTPRACIPGLPPTYSCGGQPGGGVSRQVTPVATATLSGSVTPAATTTVGAPAATATRPAGNVGGVITAPDTGSGPGSGGNGTGMLMLAMGSIGALALSGGLFAARKRR